MTVINKNPVCIVIGAGDATGAAIANRFAQGGYATVPVRRNADKLKPLAEKIAKNGGKCVPIACDARSEEQMIALFDQVESEIGPIEVVVFNIGANVRFSFAELPAQKFLKIWEMACYAGFLTCREAVRRMEPRGKGTILVTGASASIKGYANGAAFGSAKFALRGMAQSLAREMWPRGIHVAHFIIDGVIDTAFIRDNFPQAYALKDKGGVINPDHIAEIYWQVHNQPREAWTQEMDIRPFIESF